jgi:hypothetical protein
MFLNLLLFTILRPFGTRESIRRKVVHGGPIILSYWQHATNLARATMFIVCMSSARVLVKFGQGNRVHSVHEFSKSARVSEG